MKLNTIRKYNFLINYNGYTVFTDPNTGAERKTYQPTVQIECWVINNALGELILHTKSKLQNEALLLKLYNKKYEKVQKYDLVYPIGTPNGAVWRIIEGMPMFDSFGNVYEYKYRCQMIVPSQGAVTEATEQELGIGFSL